MTQWISANKNNFTKSCDMYATYELIIELLIVQRQEHSRSIILLPTWMLYAYIGTTIKKEQSIDCLNNLD